MFRTIGHTFELMKMSWRVLMKDRELIFFPIFGVIGAGIAVGVFAAIAAASGSLDRIQDVISDSDTKQELAAGDVVLLVLLYVAVYFVTIFFNAALVAAALERLRGGGPEHPIRAGGGVAPHPGHSRLGDNRRYGRSDPPDVAKPPGRHYWPDRCQIVAGRLVTDDILCHPGDGR